VEDFGECPGGEGNCPGGVMWGRNMSKGEMSRGMSYTLIRRHIAGALVGH